jgi:hypothetical protein
MTRSGGWKAKGLLFAATLAVATLSAEVVLRFAGISFPGFYTTDPYLGFAHRPGASGWFRGEGVSYVRINTDGLRDRQIPRGRQPHTLRIAVVGDSFTQALQVAQEDNFCSVMQQQLQTCGEVDGKNVEVINFGVASYSTAQQYLLFRHRVREYSPDIVLLAFYSQNDVIENSRALIGEPLRPYFELHGDKLVLDTSFRQTSIFRNSQTRLRHLKRRAVDHSRLLQLLSKARQAFRAPGGPGMGTTPEKLYAAPVDSAWADAWRVTERLICRLRDEAIQTRAQFMVVSLSNPIQAHPDSAVRHEFVNRPGVEDLFYPDERVQALCERENIPHLSLAQPFQEYASAHNVCLHGFDNCIPCDGHWNGAGHALAGRMLARFLRENLSLLASASRVSSAVVE